MSPSRENRSSFTNGVQMINTKNLFPFPNHPFQVRSDEAMQATTESIKAYGVLVPAIVRPRKEGGYEIIAGHRRKCAREQAGIETIRSLDSVYTRIVI